MNRKIQFSQYSSGNSNHAGTVEVDKFPDECPICQRSMEPIMKLANLKSDESLEVIFYCARHECQSYFIVYYKRWGSIWEFKRCAPSSLITIVFGDEVTNVSDVFSSIYNEAHRSESMDLNQISGMGYRKALEFLIKDYLINFKKIDNKLIEKTYLGTCISNHVTDPKIKLVAERATWLGNDETHYVRKWGNKDIQDLKMLIDLVVYWIISEIMTQKYFDEMPKDSKLQAP